MRFTSVQLRKVIRRILTESIDDEDDELDTKEAEQLRYLTRKVIDDATDSPRGHKQKDKRVLYHINRLRPARPQPKMTYWQEWDPDKIDREGDKGDYVNVPGSDGWKRHWLDSPVKSGVFLTPNPLDIAMKHGRSGHVYAYRVPQWVIAKSGGLHRYDTGSEVLIPEDVWNEAGEEIEFMGKSMDKEELWDKMDSAQFGRGHHRKAKKPAWMTDEELKQWQVSQDKFNLGGLRATSYPESAIQLMKPEDRERAVAAIMAKKEFEEPQRIEKGPRDKKGIVIPSFGWGLDKKDEELLALLKKRMNEEALRVCIREMVEDGYGEFNSTDAQELAALVDKAISDAQDMIQSAGVIIVDRDQDTSDPYILCLRAYNNWGFPKGRAEPGEDKEQTASRETLEETGLEADIDWSLTGEQAPSVTYGSGKKKKTASYFMADRLSEKQPSLPVNPELGHAEHDEWRWVPASQLYDIMPKRLGPVIKYIQQSLGSQL